MKEIIDALKKEPRLPSVVALLTLVLVVTKPFVESLIIYHTSTQTFSYPFGVGAVICVGMLYAIIILLTLRVLFQSFRAKPAPELDKKDERELLHEFMISDKAYRILVYGVVLYLVWTYSIALPILLLVVLLVRLRMRITLERQ